jgi:hypothetical protein
MEQGNLSSIFHLFADWDTPPALLVDFGFCTGPFYVSVAGAHGVYPEMLGYLGISSDPTQIPLFLLWLCVDLSGAGWEKALRMVSILGFSLLTGKAP